MKASIFRALILQHLFKLVIMPWTKNNYPKAIDSLPAEVKNKAFGI
jgi:hypothetical protein